MLQNYINSGKEILSTVDNFHESGGERQAVLTERLQIDMNSDSMPSKLIRPFTLFTLLMLEILIVLLSAYGYPVPTEITVQVGLLLSAAFGFYFNSKKHERIAEKRAKADIDLAQQNIKANIEVERIKAKTDSILQKKSAREERRKARFERKRKRREERSQEIEGMELNEK